MTIDLPPLRDRAEDVPVLAKEFLRRFSSECGREPLSFTQSALRVLRQHSWPGNVRELENRVKRAVIMADGRHLTPAELELGNDLIRAKSKTLKEARDEAEREVILATLQRNKWKITPAAAELEISRHTLCELMEKLGIQRPGAIEAETGP